MIETDDPDQQRAAARSVRTNRSRMRNRWLGNSGRR
jgi:hypothetical protein